MRYFLHKKLSLVLICLLAIYGGVFSQEEVGYSTTPMDYEAAVSELTKNPAKALAIVDALLSKDEFDHSEKNKADLLFLKAKAKKSLGEQEEAKAIAEESLLLFQKIGDDKSVIQSNLFIGSILAGLGKGKSAIKYYEVALSDAKDIKDTVLIVDACYGHYKYYSSIGNYESSLKFTIEALDYANSVDSMLMQKATIYISFGVIYLNLDQKEKSIEYNLKGLEIAEKGNFKSIIYHFHLNIASAYHELENVEKSEYHFKKSLQYAVDSKDPDKIAFVESYLGDFYLVEKRYREAIPLFKKSLIRLRKMKNNHEVAYSLGTLGIAEIGIGHRILGIKHMIQADSMISESDFEVYKEALYKEMADASYGFGLYKQGFDFYEKHVISKDKIRAEDSENKILELQTQYETKEKEQRIELLTKEKKANDLLIFLSALAGIFLMTMIWTLWNSRKLLKKRNVALQKAKIIAEQATKEKAEFLATMSHEIRTPMNGVIGMANILAENEPRPDQAENLDILKFSADNLLNLINDVLDLAKIESGNIELERNDFDLAAYCKKAFSVFKSGNRKPLVDLKLELNIKSLNRQLIGDTMRLNQVLTNLISNALKFTEKGSVMLKVTALEQLKDKARIKFEVIDTGIGVSREMQKKIFEKYEQATTETTRLYGGTGLGLNISKEMTRLFGSELKLESELGIGSNFFFEIEFHLSEKEIVGIEMSNLSKAKIQLDGLNFLLAEDNRVNQLVAKRILTNWGANLTIAKNGLEAVEFAKMNHYDLILMDIQMPEMDGYAATDEIRKLPYGRGTTPIVAMTASNVSTIVEKIKTHGLNGYIGKPFDPELLSKVILRHLGDKIERGKLKEKL